MDNGININKVSKGMAKKLDIFIYENKDVFTAELLTYYSEIRYAIYAQLHKPSNSRWTIDFIKKYAYMKVFEPTQYAKAIGAESYSIEFIKWPNQNQHAAAAGKTKPAGPASQTGKNG